MNSYGDGNVYRGQICRDSEIKTIEIHKYNADVERLVEAAEDAPIKRLDESELVFIGRYKIFYRKLKVALEPFNK